MLYAYHGTVCQLLRSVTTGAGVESVNGCKKTGLIQANSRLVRAPLQRGLPVARHHGPTALFRAALRRRSPRTRRRRVRDPGEHRERSAGGRRTATSPPIRAIVVRFLRRRAAFYDHFAEGIASASLFRRRRAARHAGRRRNAHRNAGRARAAAVLRANEKFFARRPVAPGNVLLGGRAAETGRSGLRAHGRPRRGRVRHGWSDN